GSFSIIYAGCDGGIYKSIDAGATWLDTINEGPCITQFEFIDQHPTSDAMVFGGTQDNGTQQFRNSPVFYHAADGDGGFVAIDQSQPRNILHEYYWSTTYPVIERSTHAGKFGNWVNVTPALAGSARARFYPPFALDQTDPCNIAFGTDRINLDGSQGTGGWPTKVTLPYLSSTDTVSAIHYVNSNLIYVGTSKGKVYRLTKTGAAWVARAIALSALPRQLIWDVTARPDDVNRIVVVMAGFHIPH